MEQLPSQPMTISQQPVVTVQADQTASNMARTRGQWKALRITGFLQVFLGIFSVLLGILSFIFKTYAYIVGIGIWIGLCFFIVAGILGIASSGAERKGLVIGYLTMSIIACVAAGVMVICAGVFIANDEYFCPDWWYLAYSHEFSDRAGCSSSHGTRMAINAVTLVVGVAQMVVAIVAASMTCCTMCLNPSPAYPVVYYQSAPQVMMAPQPQNVVQYAFVPQQQFPQQPQTGNVVYTGQQSGIPSQPQMQPLLQPQWQGQYQPAPQGAAQAQPEAPPNAPPHPVPETPNFPEDHFNKPLIT
ncbi:uncharacterized protein LOC110978271 isoform X2 [Acanthaster planci]|nr:uncharacterized protein LOC110978271 isoform X2 [Acanthaster planci]XP_022088830.1 uncharacterized protein LOC110978271 isoform X2 [Acanthaster planci]XP_022088831.1 uncharacterized protein LOC110978271 isoform X2 [Acanthaster planci]XP_022088832.1 uncharacterized protein LOC110978271 isoform X2 [Acanthaster planci]XP_022088833.1 uncharacterized protein LOC110978271 isoform X2 [Acanthaster planci]XP_022088834.1 uncharacterized protein LOC110978271 isoform X2 [Acanthaster planci]XP_02208883